MLFEKKRKGKKFYFEKEKKNYENFTCYQHHHFDLN